MIEATDHGSADGECGAEQYEPGLRGCESRKWLCAKYTCADYELDCKYGHVLRKTPRNASSLPSVITHPLARKCGGLYGSVCEISDIGTSYVSVVLGSECLGEVVCQVGYSRCPGNW